MKSFSELTSASYVSNSDILAISQENSGTYSSKKTTVKEVSDFANQNVAEEYDSTSSYAVGDYCIYESVLYKCTASTTGSFDSTKWTSVVVTDEMGSGGGGTGGHTIIDENGNSMTARAGLQFVGGANVSDDSTNNKTIVDLASAGGIDGVFVDTDNVIKSTTTFTSSMSYTATEDCFIPFYIVMSGSDGVIKIDNKKVAGFIATSTVGYSAAYYLKKGQTISVTGTHASYPSDYTVYGIKTGTTHSKFQPIIYSTEEREIGVWTDGKPIYEKTYELSTALIINAHTWGTTSIDVSFVDKFIGEADIVTSGGQGYVCFTDVDNNNLQLYNPRYDAGIGVKFITVRYTKTTDVAGSGTWTPQGVPAEHYSLDEQIIGTYFGDTLYQKTIVLTSGVSIADSWTTIYTDALIGNIAQLVDGKYNNVENKGVYGVLNFKPNGNNLQAVYPISGGLSVFAGARFTLKYTKSS